MKRYQCGDFGVPGRPLLGPSWLLPACLPTALSAYVSACYAGALPAPALPPHRPPASLGAYPRPGCWAGCYQAGQLVTYNGYLYVANVDNAAGVPGSRQTLPCCPPLQPVGLPDLPVPSAHGAPPALPDSPAHPAKPALPGATGPTGPTEAQTDGQRPGKTGENLGEFGALLMQNIPYNIQTV